MSASEIIFSHFHSGNSIADFGGKLLVEVLLHRIKTMTLKNLTIRIEGMHCVIGSILITKHLDNGIQDEILQQTLLPLCQAKMPSPSLTSNNNNNISDNYLHTTTSTIPSENPYYKSYDVTPTAPPISTISCSW